MERGHLRDRIVERRPLADSLGESGAPLEQGRLDDGRPVVIKHISWRDDIGMQATDDRGRAVQLYTSGILDRLPPGVLDVTLDAWHEDGACTLVMDDISRGLISVDRRLSPGECGRIIRALAAVHATFRDEEIPAACPTAVRMALMSPRTLRQVDVPGNRLPGWVLEGWEAFHDQVDTDVADAVAALHEDMEPLAARMSSDGTTLLHADPWLQNLALLDDDVALLDWSLATVGPAAMEYSYFLAINGWQIDLSHEEILDRCRAAEGAAMSEESLRLALLWSLADYGWNKAWHAAHNEDEEIRRREADDLAWWVAAGREGLEVWSPV